MTRRTLILLLLLCAALPVTAGAAPKPPETTITSGPADPIASHSATFTFTSDTDGDTVRFGCALDSDSFRLCTSPVVYQNVPEGLHTFFVFAVTDHGADPTPASWTWTVDTTPPPALAARRVVRYRQLALSWTSPASMGADHVVLYRSTSAKKQPSEQLYAGTATGYTDTKFDNSIYHSYRIVAVDKAGNVSPATDVIVPTSALLLSPAAGARLARPPQQLVWQTAPNAKFYNVQLWRGGEKILSSWPRAAKLTLKKKWSFGGRTVRLKAGAYTWFVWPGFGTLAKASYGKLLGQSSFRVLPS